MKNGLVVNAVMQRLQPQIYFLELRVCHCSKMCAVLCAHVGGELSNEGVHAG